MGLLDDPALLIDSLTLNEDKIGLHGYPTDKLDQEGIQTSVHRFQEKYSTIIKTVCSELGSSTFMNIILRERTESLEWENGAVLLGFVNAVELPNKQTLIKRLEDISTRLSQSDLIQEDRELTLERIRKLIRISFRTGIDKAGSNRFLEVSPGKRMDFTQVRRIFEESKGHMIDEVDLSEWEEKVEGRARKLQDESAAKDGRAPVDTRGYEEEATQLLKEEGAKPPSRDLKLGYLHFIRRVLKCNDNDTAESEIQELDRATHEAAALFNQLFEDTEKLHHWLLKRGIKDPRLTELFHTDSYDEFNRINFYQMFWAALEKEIPINGNTNIELSASEAYLGQAIAYLAFLIYWLNKDQSFSLSRDVEVNNNIESIIDKEFWNQATERHEEGFHYYTSEDQFEISREKTARTPYKYNHRPPRRVKREYLQEGPYPDDMELLIWRNEADPKTLPSTLLKVITKHQVVKGIPDHQRSEAITNISMHDMDLNPSKNPDRAERIHESLEHLAAEHAKALGLTPVPDDVPYSKIPAGTYKVVNKARWDSSKDIPKESFLAVKVYTAVPVDIHGTIIHDYTPEKHPHARIIRREFRLAPFDMWHPAKHASGSTLSHDAYKWFQSASLLLKCLPKIEFPEELALIDVLIHHFTEAIRQDKKRLYTWLKTIDQTDDSGSLQVDPQADSTPSPEAEPLA